VAAFFVRSNIIESAGEDVVTQWWSDNYVTWFPNEKSILVAALDANGRVLYVSGVNVDGCSSATE
jgi:exo-1,4-beta-D-glucosaminidase